MCCDHAPCQPSPQGKGVSAWRLKTRSNVISARWAAAMARRGLHYGWVVLTTTCLTMLVTAGAVGAPGVLLLPLQRVISHNFTREPAPLPTRARRCYFLPPSGSCLSFCDGLDGCDCDCDFAAGGACVTFG
jgi:hypothetical protein